MSKLAPHAESATAGQLDWARRAAGAKGFNGHLEAITAALETNPNAYVVYRHQPDDNLTDVNAAIAALKGLRAPNLGIEIRNEPPLSDGKGGTDWDVAARTEAETRAAIPICRAAGVRLVALCLGTGQPEPEFWAYMAAHGWFGLDPAIDSIGLHEYSYGGEIDGWNMGRFTNLLDAGWTGEVRITECGLDRCGQPSCGWRTYIQPADFDALMQRYDARLAKYPQVTLATVFSADNWQSFYYDDPNHLFNRGGTTLPDFVIGPGFAAKVAEKGWHAASDEVYFTQDANAKLSVLACDEGLLFYDSANNKVGALPFE